MKPYKIMASALAIALLAGSFAFAEDRRGDRQDFKYKQKQKHGNNGRGPQDQGNQGRGPNRGQPERQNEDHRPDMREQRGAGPEHQFQRGNRLPPQYRQNIYVVNDWRSHQLPPPPRNHYWVQTGADYVLVAIASGIIVQLILSSSY